MGYVTVFGWQTISVFPEPLRPTQPPTLGGTRNKYEPKFSDALRLGSKGRMAQFICNGWQVKLCDHSLTRASLSALEMSIAHIIKHYGNVLFIDFNNVAVFL